MQYVISLILVGLVAVLLLQLDDPLDADLERLLDSAAAEPPDASTAYLYGFGAPDNEKPAVAGARVMAAIARLQNTAPIKRDMSIGVPTALPFPDGPMFCDIGESRCLPALFENAAERDAALSAHRLLLARYERFMGFGRFRSHPWPHLELPLPHYRYLIAGTRLFLLARIRQFVAGDEAVALDRLHSHLKQIRRLLAGADDLVLKLVMAATANQTLEVMALLEAKTDYEQVTSLAPLSRAERSLEAPLVRELRGMLLMYREMDRNPHFFSEEETVPGWLVRLVFKPNMTLNASYPFHAEMIRRSLLSSADFARLADSPPAEEPDAFSVRNAIGNILVNMARPDYHRYIARLADLDVKIRLFNALAENQGAPDPASLTNPYYPNRKTPGHELRDGRLCLEGPREDGRGFRCIPLPSMVDIAKD